MNSLATVPERIVLPRLSDAVQSMLSAVTPGDGPELAEVFVLDFKDAFKQLVVHPDERRFLAGRARLDGQDGHFYYRSVLFGVVSGPLVWGRCASALCRFTAGMLGHSRARLQCFVDDPLLALGGSRNVRDCTASFVLLLWTCLGFTLSWAKGQRGTSIDWIGASLTYYQERGTIAGVEVNISAEKREKLERAARELFSNVFINRQALREFAGLCSWVASVVPALRAFVAMFWAAATSRPARTESDTSLHGGRVTLALRWVIAFCELRHLEIPRRFPLLDPGPGPRITFDASLTGGGATFEVLRPGSTWHLVEYLSSVWSEEDRTLLGTTAGDPAAQALWEAYALLVAVCTWEYRIRQSLGRLTLRGEAGGVLQAVACNRARDPRLNFFVAETNSVLGPTMHELSAVPWWSEQNHLCDLLSRCHAELHSLPALRAAAQVTPKRATWRLLRPLPRAAGAGSAQPPRIG